MVLFGTLRELKQADFCCNRAFCALTVPPMDPYFDVEALKREAHAPLTPSEIEEKRSNTNASLVGKEIGRLVKQITLARGRWMEDRIVRLLPPDHPEWRRNPTAHAPAITAWLKSEGYNVVQDGVKSVLRRQETVLSVFEPRFVADKTLPKV